MKKIISTILAALMLITLVSCTVTDNRKSSVPPKQNTFDVTKKDKVNIKIELTDGRVMEAELYPDIAPVTVQNFVDLCTSGFYDGLIFHRVESDFVIQTGDPNGNGTGGSGQTIKGEFSDNGFENNLNHAKGVLSMARKSSGYDTATSQFFIVCGATNSSKVKNLDGRYAAFGKLTSGYDVLAEIRDVKVDSSNKPLEDVTIKYIRVIED